MPRCLLVDAFDPGDADRHVVAATGQVLADQGYEVETHHLVTEGFRVAMSRGERIAYETEAPLQAGDTRRAAAAVAGVDALVFCHPTVLFGVPPILKGWLDRVLVLGVAFEFGPRGRIRPALTHVRRIGVVTTTRHRRRRRWKARDLTHRTLGRTLWLSCSRRCRRTFVRLPTGVAATNAQAEITAAFSRW